MNYTIGQVAKLTNKRNRREFNENSTEKLGNMNMK